jgi:PAS domain-containing protein
VWLPLAEGEAGWGWVVGVATAVGGLVGAVSTALIAWTAARNKGRLDAQAAAHRQALELQAQNFANELARSKAASEGELVKAKAEREDRSGTIAEWREIANDLQTKLDSSDRAWRERLDGSEKNWQARHDSQQKQIVGLLEGKSDCEKYVAELKGEVRLLQSSMQRVQEHTGTVPLPTLPGLLIFGTDGVVRVSSPAGSAMFDRLPAEVEGQNITTLIPELGSVLKSLRETGQPPWTERAVLGTGRRKGGGEFPLTANLRGWQTGGEWLVRAEVRPRQAGDGPNPPPAGQGEAGE